MARRWRRRRRRSANGNAVGWPTLCPRFNKRSDVEATTRLANEAMPIHNPYAPFTPFVPLANHRSHQLYKPQSAELLSALHFQGIPTLPRANPLRLEHHVPGHLAVEDHEQGHFHGEADDIFNEPAHENRRSRLVVIQGQPQCIEPQMDKDHDKEKGDAHIGKCDLAAVKEFPVNKARQKSGNQESREKYTGPQAGGSDEVRQGRHQSPFPGTIEGPGQGNGKESEGHPDKRRLYGKDIGQEHCQPRKDSQNHHLFSIHFLHNKRPPLRCRMGSPMQQRDAVPAPQAVYGFSSG